MAKKALTFEQALKQLETIAERIEQGTIGLEESIQKYEEGMSLVHHCRDILAQAELKIQQVRKNADGSAELTPFKGPKPSND